MILVQCHGHFDGLHYGHLKHLQAARALGDRLWVTITADAYVTKGPGRPVFNERERREMLLALRCVDHCTIIYAPDALPAIEAVRPNIYVKGKEYDGKCHEQSAVECYGGRVAFVGETLYSSTALLTGRHLEVSGSSDRRRDSGRVPLCPTAGEVA
jgi:rfaE bifunctional protein nucleotidyltransferase chain/domain